MSSHSINPAIYASLPFDTERDFRPISLVCSLPQLFAVNPATPYRTFQDLVQYMKQNPGKIRGSSTGVGSVGHFGYEVIRMETGQEIWRQII